MSVTTTIDGETGLAELGMSFYVFLTLHRLTQMFFTRGLPPPLCYKSNAHLFHG